MNSYDICTFEICIELSNSELVEMNGWDNYKYQYYNEGAEWPTPPYLEDNQIHVPNRLQGSIFILEVNTSWAQWSFICRVRTEIRESYVYGFDRATDPWTQMSLQEAREAFKQLLALTDLMHTGQKSS